MYKSVLIEVANIPQLIFACKVKHLQNVEIYAEDACYIGAAGVATTNGMPLGAGESRMWNHTDFRKDSKDVQESLFEVYAVAAVAASVRVSAVRS